MFNQKGIVMNKSFKNKLISYFFDSTVFLAIIAFGAIIGCLLAYPIKWSWNYSVVSIWNLPAITWGQAWCLAFLAACFIKPTNSK